MVVLFGPRPLAQSAGPPIFGASTAIIRGGWVASAGGIIDGIKLNMAQLIGACVHACVRKRACVRKHHAHAHTHACTYVYNTYVGTCTNANILC